MPENPRYLSSLMNQALITYMLQPYVPFTISYSSFVYFYVFYVFPSLFIYTNEPPQRAGTTLVVIKIAPWSCVYLNCWLHATELLLAG